MPLDLIVIGIGGTLIFVMVIALLRPRRQGGVDPSALAQMNDSINALNQAQHQMAGALKALAEQQNDSQMKLTNVLNQRLEQVQLKMG